MSDHLGEKTGVLILLFNDEAELFTIFSKEKVLEQARHWIHRRLEKTGKECTQAFYATEAIHVPEIIAEYWEEQSKYEREIREQQEKHEYERLKKKFEADK